MCANTLSNLKEYLCALCGHSTLASTYLFNLTEVLSTLLLFMGKVHNCIAADTTPVLCKVYIFHCCYYEMNNSLVFWCNTSPNFCIEIYFNTLKI